MNTYLEKKNKLPQLVKKFLVSDKPNQDVKLVCFMYGLDEKEVKIVSYPIASIFIGELKLEDYPLSIFKKLNRSEQIIYGISFEINQRIFSRFPDFFKNSQNLLEEWSKKKTNPLISENEAWKKITTLEPWILEEEKEKTQESKKEEETTKMQQSQLENLPMSTALEKYPAIGEQLITSSHIKLKTDPKPVRPSIKNWLADYIFKVGISNYDPIVRGNYLFKSENGKILSDQDRERLATIIKSFEEKIPLVINSNTKQVVFNTPKKQEAPKNPTINLAAIGVTTQKEKAKDWQDKQSTPKKSPLASRFQTDEERIGAWRRDLTQKETPIKETGTENVRFSSPQKFSTEKPAESSSPVSQNNPHPQIAKINYTAPSRPTPKNVVDLREENSM